MEVEVGVGLIRLADPRRGGDLLERIQRVRQNVASDIGIINISSIVIFFDTIFESCVKFFV